MWKTDGTPDNKKLKEGFNMCTKFRVYFSVSSSRPNLCFHLAEAVRWRAAAAATAFLTVTKSRCVSTAARSLTLIQRTLSRGSQQRRPQNLAGTRVYSFLPTLGRCFGSSKMGFGYPALLGNDCMQNPQIGVRKAARDRNDPLTALAGRFTHNEADTLTAVAAVRC